MKSMKLERELQDSREKRSIRLKQGDAVRSFMLITLCAFAAVIIAVGSKVLDNSESGKVYAAEDHAVISSDSLPTGIAGVVTGVRDTASTEKSINRIGTSCEEVMVGQRIQKVDDSVTEFDISSSMEDRVNDFDEKSVALATPTIMSDTDYDTLLRIVEAEAGTEDIKGRVLIANVIMNRIKSDEFPDTVTEVVWDYSNGVPQFSPTYDGTIGEVTVSDETREAVRLALEGTDYSQGALFFIQKSAAEEHNISWFEKDLKKLFKHGVHEFYTYPDEIKTDAADSGEKKSAGKEEQSEAAKDHDDTVVQMVKNDAE